MALVCHPNLNATVHVVTCCSLIKGGGLTVSNSKVSISLTKISILLTKIGVLKL